MPLIEPSAKDCCFRHAVYVEWVVGNCFCFCQPFITASCDGADGIGVLSFVRSLRCERLFFFSAAATAWNRTDPGGGSSYRYICVCGTGGKRGREGGRER